MASTQELDTIVLGGLMVKLSIAGMSTLWLYDYFLTLADEIEWGWSGRKRWGFALFILNRYWPVWWLSFNFAAFWNHARPMCHKTSWVTMIYLIFATFFAQVVVTQRARAVTGGNRWVASCLSLITLGQLGVGMYLAVNYTFRPMMELPDLPLGEYQACFPRPVRTRELLYPSISISYDTLALAPIVYSARGWTRMHLAGVPSLFGTIVENATAYFLIVFTNHLAVILAILIEDFPMRFLPSCLISIMMPMMTTRMWISLKKAANPPNSTSANTGSLRFAFPTIEVAEDGSDDIPLEDISPGERAGPSQSCGRS